MLYAVTQIGGYHVIILELNDLENLKRGRVRKTPDGKMFLAYTPDMPWFKGRLHHQIMTGKIDVDELEQILAEGFRREGTNAGG